MLFFIIGISCMLTDCNRTGTTIGHFNINQVFSSPKDRALILAAARGDVKKVNQLAKERVNVNVVGKYGATPLFWITGQPKINYDGLKALLELGANPNYIPPHNTNLGGYSVTYALGGDKDLKALQLVLEHGGNPNIHNPNDDASGNNETVLMAAAENGRIKNIKLLLKYGADLEGKDNTGMTALLWAAFDNQFETAYFLLEQGADYKVSAYFPGSEMDPKYRDKLIKTNISDLISDSLRQGLSDNQKPWREKVIQWLEAHGVPRPKPSRY